MVKWITISTIILALAGLSMGVYTMATSDEPLPDAPPAQPPSVNPFARGIAATGIVEAASRNIEIAAPEPGLVVTVVAGPNEVVKKGQVLFVMDTRLLEAELLRMTSALGVAQADLARIQAQPRVDDIPPLRAAIETAKVEAADAQDQYERTLLAYHNNAATEGERAHRKFVAEATKAEVAEAEARLVRLMAGPWGPDVDAAQARVRQAQAEIDALKVRLARATVRAPIDGTVLKRFIEPGEYAAANPAMPAMVLGDLTTLHVRAQVDEEDTPLLAPGSAGSARLRGPLNREFPLRMLRIEPYAQGKMNLTGGTTERVDTRVLDVVFTLDAPADGGPLPYPGELVDVFIQTPAPATQPAR